MRGMMVLAGLGVGPSGSGWVVCRRLAVCSPCFAKMFAADIISPGPRRADGGDGARTAGLGRHISDDSCLLQPALAPSHPLAYDHHQPLLDPYFAAALRACARRRGQPSSACDVVRTGEMLPPNTCMGRRNGQAACLQQRIPVGERMTSPWIDSKHLQRPNRRE